MFGGASSFNSDISSWNVGHVTNMQFMFYYASGFNSNISNWNVGAVTVMRYMFDGASSFNSDVSNWDVSSVTVMRYMFNEASSFNQNLCPWGPELPANFNYGTSGAAYNIFVNSACPNTNMPSGPSGPWCKATCP
jgi:surface protein